jgi:hypothetical protein
MRRGDGEPSSLSTIIRACREARVQSATIHPPDPAYDDRTAMRCRRVVPDRNDGERRARSIDALSPHGAKAGYRNVSRRHRRRSVSLAGERRRARSAGMGHGAERVHAPLPRCDSRAAGDRQAGRGAPAFATPAAVRLPIPQASVRVEAPAAAQSADAGGAQGFRRARDRTDDSRSGDDRPNGPHGDRFLSRIV